MKCKMFSDKETISFPCQFRRNEIELCQDENQDRVNEFQFRFREKNFRQYETEFRQKENDFATRFCVRNCVALQRK